MHIEAAAVYQSYRVAKRYHLGADECRILPKTVPCEKRGHRPTLRLPYTPDRDRCGEQYGLRDIRSIEEVLTVYLGNFP